MHKPVLRLRQRSGRHRADLCDHGNFDGQLSHAGANAASFRESCQPGSYKVNGQTYQYKLDNSAPWKLTQLKGDSVYVTDKNVVLYVSDSISESGSTVIYIARNASLTLYVGAPATTTGGQGIANASGRAQNFTYSGLPTNTQFDLGANVAFVGNIYAPQAALSLGGGGANTYDFIG